MATKFSLEKVESIPTSMRQDTKELIDGFLKSGYAFARIVGAVPSTCTSLRNNIKRLNLDKKIFVYVRGKQVFFSKTPQ